MRLPSGRLVAQDPYMNGEDPFEEPVPAGYHRVYVSTVWLDGGSERVAGAMVAFHDDALQRVQRGELRWQAARRKVEGRSDPFRFGVDYATAAFMDEEVARWLSKNDPGRESISAWLEMAGRGTGVDVRGTGGNLVAFSSGAGDGVYVSWWGMDAEGRRACLVIDFELMAEEAEAPLGPDAPLFTAVKRRDVAAVRASRAKKAELGCEPDHGISPLHWATHAGLLDMVQALLERGANPNLKLARDESLWGQYLKGSTALLIAVERSHFELVQALLGAGASPNVASNRGLTPLHLAALAGHLPTVSALLGAGAEVGAQTRGDLWQKSFLLRHPRGTTALHVAAAAGHAEVVAELLRSHAPLDLQDEEGFTALHHAARLQRVTIAEQLLRAGAKADLVCKEGTTPLWQATWSSPDDEGAVAALIRALASAGAVRKEVAFGNTALHRAAGHGAAQVIRALLEAGFDPNDAQGKRSPLVWAAAEGHLEAVKVLVEAGARVDEGGKHSAREEALQKGHPEVLRYLDQVLRPEVRAKPPL
ncbi:MAG TPA: ankyrin repeat domain-containing protein, partial [Myxococcaceae bacterium]